MKKKIILFVMLSISICFTAADCEKDTSYGPATHTNYQAVKLYTENSGGTWEHHDVNYGSIPADAINDICAFSSIDLSAFCIVMDRVYILKTTNYGNNFTQVYQSPNPVLDMVNAGVNGTGFAVGSQGLILKTTDDGTSWTKITIGDNNEWGTVDFADQDNGIIIGTSAYDSVYSTTNGGISWRKSKIPTDKITMEVKFTSTATETDAIACGLEGTIFRTTNTGLTWSPITSPTTRNLMSVDFKYNTGVIVSHEGEILKSTNGGLVWSSIAQTGWVFSNKIIMDYGRYWLLANEIHSSTDGGFSWNNMGGNINNTTFTNAIFSENAGFVVGYRRY